MRLDPYITYINGVGVAVAWIGALLGPAFILVGQREEITQHLFVGGVLVLVALVAVVEGVRTRHRSGRLATAVKTVVPTLLLIVGVSLAWLAVE